MGFMDAHWSERSMSAIATAQPSTTANLSGVDVTWENGPQASAMEVNLQQVRMSPLSSLCPLGHVFQLSALDSSARADDRSGRNS